MNKVILVGNVGRAPKVWLTQKGVEIATFFVATKQSWKDAQGEWQSATDWHRVSVFRESTIKWMKDILKKGDPVSIEGKLAYQSWTDKYGQQRWTPHVVVAGSEGKVQRLPNASNKNTVQSAPSNSNLPSEEETPSFAPENPECTTTGDSHYEA